MTKKPAPAPAPAPLPWGCVAAGLTQIGNAWIDMRRVVAIEFQPGDGCGLEITFENDSETFHLPASHIAPMKAWLKQQAEMEMMQLKSDLAYAASRRSGEMHDPLDAPKISRIVTEEMIASI